MSHPTLEAIVFFQRQFNATDTAINYLSTLGCSSISLKPYQDHLSYLLENIDCLWNDFKNSVEEDNVRVNMCSELNWMPVIGSKYQDMISDPEFKKRWNS